MKKTIKYLIIFFGLFLCMNVNVAKAADKTCVYFGELDMLGKNQDMGDENKGDPNTLRAAYNAKLVFSEGDKKGYLYLELEKGKYTKIDYEGKYSEALVLSQESKKYGIDTYKSKSFQKVRIAYFANGISKAKPDEIYKEFVDKGRNSCPKIQYHEEANLADGSYYRGTVAFSYDESKCSGESGMTDNTCSSGKLEGQTKEEEDKDGTKVKTSCVYSIPSNKFKNTAAFEISFNVTNNNTFLYTGRSRNNSGEGVSITITNDIMSKNKFESVRLADSVTGTVNGQYNIGAYGSTFKKVFTQTDKQKTDRSITCPSTVYALQDDKNNKQKITISLENKDGAIALSKGTMEENGYESSDRANDDAKESITVYRIRKPSVKVNLKISKNGCDVLGKDLKAWLQWLLDVIRIGGVVLSVVLGIMDYIGAIASSNKDAYNKANKNLSTRVICVGLLFLVPITIEFILQLFNIGVTGDNPRCGIN